jgi:NADH dehydrogenase [ubiquinone] 1 alpha subcomplex assembly factor 5
MALSIRCSAVPSLFRRTCVRRYASVSPTSGPTNPYTVGPYNIFDRDVKNMQRDRAAARMAGERSKTVDYLREEVAERMMERFMVCTNVSQVLSESNAASQDIKRNFDTVLDLGSGPGHFSKLLWPEKAKKSVMLDSSSTSPCFQVCTYFNLRYRCYFA